jgi:hypothetical protein
LKRGLKRVQGWWEVFSAGGKRRAGRGSASAGFGKGYIGLIAKKFLPAAYLQYWSKRQHSCFPSALNELSTPV